MQTGPNSAQLWGTLGPKLCCGSTHNCMLASYLLSLAHAHAIYSSSPMEALLTINSAGFGGGGLNAIGVAIAEWTSP